MASNNPPVVLFRATSILRRIRSREYEADMMFYLGSASTIPRISFRTVTALVPLLSLFSAPTVADWVLSVWVALKFARAERASQNVRAVAFVVISRNVMFVPVLPGWSS